MNRVTASGSGRILQCSGHVRLPWVRESSAAADEGTRLHAIMDGEGLDADAYRERVEGEAQTLAAWEAWQAWAPFATTLGRKHHERAGIVDTESRTARWLPRSGHRDYGAVKWHEVAGTADLIAETPDAIFVVDWKFGREAVDASESAQLRTLAAIAALNPEYAAIDRFHAVIVQAPPGARPWLTERTYDRADLLAHVEMMGDALNEANEGRVQLSRGKECGYCPARDACPAQLASLSAIVAPGGPSAITPERAGAIWMDLRQAKKRLEAIEDACKALAAELPDGLPLPGGKRLVATTRSRTTVDAKALEAIARDHGATDGEIAACARTTTYSTTQEVK